MVEIKSYGSSSAGNSYIIKDGSQALMIEAGIKLDRMHGVDWKSVDACIISHEHGDHAKYAKNLLRRTAVDIYASGATIKELQLPKHRTVKLNKLKQRKIKGWRIVPFDVEHDAIEPLGFYIESPSKEIILFATDTYYIKYKFPKIHYLMIECNYASDILNQKVISGALDPNLSSRVVKSHFELNNVKKFIMSNNISELKEVWLLHLSDRNSDEKRFKAEVQQITGVPVYIP